MEIFHCKAVGVVGGGTPTTGKTLNKLSLLIKTPTAIIKLKQIATT